MNERFDAISGVFPRWKVTPELARLCESKFDPFTVEQVRLAAEQHRLERRGDDPDLGTILTRLKGTRHPQQPGSQYHAAGGTRADEYNNRPYTEQDRRWDQLCDSWRADLREAKAQPGFTPEGWARSAFPLFMRDIRSFGHTSKTFATAYLIKLARDCGVTVQPKSTTKDAQALISMVTGS